MSSVLNTIRISSNDKLNLSPNGDFFRLYAAFLQPVHNLTDREMDVLAEYMKERHRLCKKISDEETVDKILMSDETRKKIREVCGIKPRHINVIISAFRKKGVLKDNKFYANLIPTISKTGAGLLILFDFKHEQQRIKLSS